MDELNLEGRPCT